MRFSIITPSFRNGLWLKLNIPSVADQDVEHEHIIQDACSDDGTRNWLPQEPRVTAYFEKDSGMYNAINRGLRRAKGQILAYLNCDEQYLPGALSEVDRFFHQHPEVDVVFADAVVIDPQGNYVCHRGATLPTRWHTLVGRTLAVLTCSTFFRRRLLDERGLYFPEGLRALGDAQWVLSLLRARVKMGVLKCFTSAFADTGDNMSLNANAQREIREMSQSAPALVRALRPAIVARYRLQKLLLGDYHRPPFRYQVYTLASPERRVDFEVSHPTGVWKRYQPKA